MPVLVKLKPDASIAFTARKHGLFVGRHIAAIGVHRLSLPPQANEQAVLGRLKNDPQVEFAEVDAYALPAMVTNDPQIGNEWHLTKIRAQTAWNTTQGDPSIVVAVIDTGVTPVTDLVPSLVPGWSVWDNTSDTTDKQSGTGHGTAVAGVVAAAGNNAYQCVGVAFKTKVMPIRIHDGVTPLGTNWSVIAAGITYAADHGCKVANCSWESNPPMWTSSTLQSAVAYLRGKGGVMCFAAGNANSLMNYTLPPGWIVTSGTDKYDARSTFSNYGTVITVAAPANSIKAVAKNGSVYSWTGTSFSSPISASIVALMRAANPALTPDQCVAKIKSSAVDLGAAGVDQYFGSGRVDAASALV